MIAMIRSLASQVANAVVRGKHQQAGYNPQKTRTLVQYVGLDNEVHQNVELLLPHGMSAIPAGQTADLIILQVLGHRDHKVALFADDPALRIPDLAAGEIGHRDSRGQQIVLRGNRIEITSPSNPIAITVGGASFSFNSDGTIRASGNIIAGYGGGDQVTVQHHTHTQPNDSHGDTEQPTAAPTAGT